MLRFPHRPALDLPFSDACPPAPELPYPVQVAVMTRKLLLLCGIASSLLYAAMTALVPLRWPGYSSFSQTISELSAVGAPTRAVWVPLGVLYTLLVAAFGLGVRQSARGNRPLRIVGGLLVAYGLIGLGWMPMHQRAVLAAGGGTLSDTMHLVWATLTVALMMMTIGVGSRAFGLRFLAYSLATMGALLVFGGLTFLEAPRVAANLPTPWLGVWERINVGVFMSWIVALVAVVWPNAANAGAAVHDRASPFRTPEGEAAFLAAYDAAMKAWPVPYEELTTSSRFGTTHVVVSGPENGAPLVLLHGYMATLTMWAPSVADFTPDHRVYAIDVMGQPGKSIPSAPIRSGADYLEWLTATLDALHLDRVKLIGMSYGGWLAFKLAIAAPARVEKLVLLSPAASFLPVVRSFRLRGMLMMLLPMRATVRSFMRWLGFEDVETFELMCLGLRHFRLSPETLRVETDVFSDDQLRGLAVPVLLLLGDREVIYDPGVALARARALIPDVEGDLVPDSSHDMCFSQRRFVDARVRDFLGATSGTSRSSRTRLRAIAGSSPASAPSGPRRETRAPRSARRLGGAP